MARYVTRHPDLALIISIFPKQSLAARELYLRNETFRALCGDYALACNSLARFETLPDADARPEPSDYRAVISELETEIAALLYDTSRPNGPLHSTHPFNRTPRRS